MLYSRAVVSPCEMGCKRSIAHGFPFGKRFPQ